jgi:uncharacterized membrane protein YqhA
MNTTERKPILETLKRYGSSRLFLTAMVLSLLGAFLKYGYEIFISIKWMIVNGNADKTAAILTVSSAAVALVFAILVFYGLFSTYRYYSEKTDKGSKVDFSIKMLGLSYIAECAFFIGELFAVGGDDSSVTVGIIILVGLALLYALFYRGIRISAEYEEHAAANSPRGRISGAVIAILLTALIIYVAVIAFHLIMGGRALFTPTTDTESQAQQVSDAIVNLINLLLLAPTMASCAYYLKLIKLFRRDMNQSREEWAEIERKAKRSGL